MALTREGIETLKRNCTGAKNSATGNDDGYNAQFVDKFNNMTENPDFNTWIEGTEFGAQFYEKLDELRNVEEEYRKQFLELMGKVEKYIAKQEEINASGGN